MHADAVVAERCTARLPPRSLILCRMKAVCPQCHGTLKFSDAGGLFEARCPNCDWKAEGTVSYTWPEVPRAERMPVMAAKATRPVPAATLKCMRELFIEAQRLPLSQLAAQLTSEVGLQVGHLAQYRMSDIEACLAPAGVRLERMPHDDEDR